MSRTKRKMQQLRNSVTVPPIAKANPVKVVQSVAIELAKLAEKKMA